MLGLANSESQIWTWVVAMLFSPSALLFQSHSGQLSSIALARGRARSPTPTRSCSTPLPKQQVGCCPKRCSWEEVGPALLYRLSEEWSQFSPYPQHQDRLSHPLQAERGVGESFLVPMPPHSGWGWGQLTCSQTLSPSFPILPR